MVYPHRQAMTARGFVILSAAKDLARQTERSKARAKTPALREAKGWQAFSPNVLEPQFEVPEVLFLLESFVQVILAEIPEMDLNSRNHIVTKEDDFS